MPTLALMEQGMTLAVEGEQFSIEREGAVVNRVRMTEVDEVLVFGAVSLTPAAIAALLQRGIDTVFLTAHGRYRGRLVGKPGRNIELRVAQFERVRDPAVAVPLARALVGGKVANQRYILLRAQREQRREDLAEAIGSLRRLLEAIEGAGSVEVVRGLEGQGAAVYFGVFGKCIRNPEFSFTTRTRRPPRNSATPTGVPTNARSRDHAMEKRNARQPMRLASSTSSAKRFSKSVALPRITSLCSRSHTSRMSSRAGSYASH